MDTSHIISGNELRRLHRTRRWWAAGWIVAMAAALVAAWEISAARAYGRALAEVRAIHELQVEDREAQVKATNAQIQMWEQLNGLSQTIEPWARSVHDLAEFNRNLPEPRPQKHAWK